MEMKTILAILYANGMENVVSKAVAIDNECDNRSTQTHIKINVDKKNLSKGKMFKDNKSSGYINCPIIGYGQYKLSDEYLVQLPNDSTRWTSIMDSRYQEDLTEVVDIPEPQQAPEPHPSNA